jgi:hypothetical protein
MPELTLLYDSTRDPYASALGDWRLSAVSWATNPNGSDPAEPLRVFGSTVLRERNGDQISFSAPSSTALHMNTAWKAARRAEAAKARVEWEAATNTNGRRATAVKDATTVHLFDFFEESMTSALSAYAAVEAFCNSTIIHKATPVPHRRKKDVITLTPEEAERQLSTAEKLKRVLPDLLGRPTPAGKQLWQDFVELETLRNGITHFKRRDSWPGVHQESEPTMLLRLYQGDAYWPAEVALKLIWYFYPPTTTVQRWLKNPEWKRPDSGSASSPTVGSPATP